MNQEEQTNIIEIRVDEDLAGQRADVALAQRGVLETRSQIRKLFDHKLVLINNKAAKPSTPLSLNDEIFITLPDAEADELTPYDFPVDIIYEDEQILVVNKPSGLVVHPACGHKNDTLINALMHHHIQLSTGSANFRPGLVHRIDKDTSGLLVIAKTDSAHSRLAKQFERKTIHRRYEAICFGNIKESSGTVSSYLSRSPGDRKKFRSTNEEAPHSKHAITHWELLKRSHHFSWLGLQLETGRTHQIRVHLASLHHPIVGDGTYGGKKRSLPSQKLQKDILEMDRFALHAKELGFVHPETNENLRFSVDWPESIKKWILDLDWWDHED